jgi:flagellar basal body P-ring protein FlgI
LAAGLAGCGGGEGPAARQVDPVVRDIPAPLRGTIDSEASLRGVEPTLVSGLGLVVNLPGTGGGPYPAPVQATMERELARRGLGRATQGERHPLAGRTPKEILADQNVAVVLVEGVVPPGAPKGAVFDVRVSTLPGSGVTSLEGGELWTTDLRFGPASVFGGAQARQLATARGPVFINPFAQPSMAAGLLVKEAGGVSEGAGEGAGDGRAAARDAAQAGVVSDDGIVRTSGRVLGGGVVTDPLALELVLDNPSHARASAIQSAINSRFPQEAGQQDQTARGRNDQSLALRVPPSYKDRSADFVRTLLGLRTEQAFAQEYARQAVEELEKNPGLSEELTWVLMALGRPAEPFLGRLYEHPEFLPRFSGLRVGARLGDPRVAPVLRRIGTDRSEPVALRAEAVELMGFLGTDPNVDLALRELASAEDLEVRLAAFEAMDRRNDRSLRRTNVSGKFELVSVPADDELIYVTQSGRPRVVVFGRRARVAQPVLAGVWSDRLLVASDGEGEPVRVLYRDARRTQGEVATSKASLSDFIRLLAHKPSPENPEPGFGMSYSEVVGAIYSLQSVGAIGATFVVERDRLVDRLFEAQALAGAEDRADNAAALKERREARAQMVNPKRSAPVPAGGLKPSESQQWVVPLPKRER